MLLSYGGTIGIICFMEIFKEKINGKGILEKIKGIFFVSLSAQIMIMPIMAYIYKTTSITFFIANILTSSLIGAIIIFGFLLIFISFISLEFGVLLGKIYKLLIDLLNLITEITSQIPLSQIYVKKPYLWEIIVYYILIFGIYYLYKKLGRKRLLNRIKDIAKKYYKKFIAVILIITIITSLWSMVPKNLKIYFVDVGQGDSMLIVTPKNTKILVDGGGSETADVGKNTLLPYLLNRRINKIDYIICSHFDTDHVRAD